MDELDFSFFKNKIDITPKQNFVLHSIVKACN